tara:strand:+ start:283 stop:477 length:195 start_codon:yes stop_codon:yes gene_type:complete
MVKYKDFDELKKQKRREYSKEYYQKNKEKAKKDSRDRYFKNKYGDVDEGKNKLIVKKGIFIIDF